MPAPFDVFLSFKHSDADGCITPDSALAREVHDYLTDRGLSVFCSSVTLERSGVAAYSRAIDDALDEASVLIAIGTSTNNLDARWVRYEWESFFSDIRSGIKPDGRIFVYLDGVNANALPRALRQTQVLTHGPGQIEKLHRFVTNRPLSTAAPPETIDRAGTIRHDHPEAQAPEPHFSQDELRREAISLVARGERQAAVALLTEQVKVQRALSNPQGQVRALLALAHVVSLLPGKADRAFELAGRAMRICRRSGSVELVDACHRELEAIGEKTRSEQRNALGRWVRDVLAAEGAPLTPRPHSMVHYDGTPGSRIALDTIRSFDALNGAWEWITDVETGRIAVDGYARCIDGRLWLPYSFGEPDTLAAMFYGFLPVGDALVGRFSWFASPLHGYARWRIHDADLITGEWWYAADVEDPTFAHPPGKPGFRLRFVRVEGKTVPSWAEDVFDEILLRTEGTPDA